MISVSVSKACDSTPLRVWVPFRKFTGAAGLLLFFDLRNRQILEASGVRSGGWAAVSTLKRFTSLPSIVFVRFGLNPRRRNSCLQNLSQGSTWRSAPHPVGPPCGISGSRVSGMIVNGWNRVDPFPPGFDISNSEPMPRLRYDGSRRNLSADPTAAIRRSRYCLSLGQRDCPGIPVIRRTQTVATVCGRLRFHHY